jgi:hypothetical protein
VGLGWGWTRGGGKYWADPGTHQPPSIPPLLEKGWRDSGWTNRSRESTEECRACEVRRFRACNWTFSKMGFRYCFRRFGYLQASQSGRAKREDRNRYKIPSGQPRPASNHLARRGSEHRIRTALRRKVVVAAMACSGVPASYFVEGTAYPQTRGSRYGTFKPQGSRRSVSIPLLARALMRCVAAEQISAPQKSSCCADSKPGRG